MESPPAPPRPLQRGCIYLANLNPPRRSEPGKVRPVLVVQTDLLNAVGHPSTLIVPLTSRRIDGLERLRYPVSRRERLAQDSDLLLDQLRAIDNGRITSDPIASLSDEEMDETTARLGRLIGD